MDLNGRIEVLRRELIDLARIKDWSSPEVLAISGELDQLIYKKMEAQRHDKSSKYKLYKRKVKK